MRNFLAGILVLMLCTAAFGRGQCWDMEELTALDKHNVAGGQGTLYGEFSFTREQSGEDDAIKEIGFMTLKPGAYIGLHAHADNEDAYLILSGKGVFTDGEGNAYVVKAGDMTIARPGQSHGLANLYGEDLLFLDIIAKNSKADLDAVKATPTPQYFPAEKLFDRNTEHAGGTGKGTLYGKFAFRREQATQHQAIKEIGLMTLKPGASIGLHQHKDNEDTYIILAGQGLFTDSEGGEYMVGPNTVTLAGPGQAHALENTGNDDLVFIDLIAQTR